MRRRAAAIDRAARDANNLYEFYTAFDYGALQELDDMELLDYFREASETVIARAERRAERRETAVETAVETALDATAAFCFCVALTAILNWVGIGWRFDLIFLACLLGMVWHHQAGFANALQIASERAQRAVTRR